MELEQSPTPETLGAALNPRALYLVILPTERCNFRCAYCYQDFSGGTMQQPLVQGIKRLIDRRLDDLEYLHLSWFGGEPLCAADIVFEVSEHAQRRCVEKKVRHLEGELTTNGFFLTPEVMGRLVRANQKHFHISLDGLGEVHDRTRPQRSGRGSFAKLWSNLLALRAGRCDFHIVLRLHFGACALGETEALCREVNSCFGGDGRFRVYLKSIEDYGGEKGGRIEPMSRENVERACEHLAGFLPDVALINGLEEQKREICFAAQPNNLLIRADGRVGKCTVALNDPANTVGRLDQDGRLHIDHARLQPWLAGYRHLDRDLLACPYSGLRDRPRSGRG